MRYVLGIDQGGTQTNIILSDIFGNLIALENDNEISIIYKQDLLPLKMDRIKLPYNRILEKSGIKSSDIAIVVAGMRGADWPFQYEILAEALNDTLDNSNIQIVNDCIVALRAETLSNKCAIIVLGTGGNCAIINQHGNIFIYGDYMPEKDQGAEALGHDAIDAVCLSYVGILPKTLLSEYLLAFTDTASIPQLVEDYYYKKPLNYRIDQLAIFVTKAAEAKDNVAIQIIRNMAYSITHYIIAGFMQNNISDESTKVVLSGGLFKYSRLLSDTVISVLQEKLPKVSVIKARHEPVCGAVLMALEKYYDKQMPESIIANFKKCCEIPELIRKCPHLLYI